MSTPEPFTVVLTRRAQKETHKLDRNTLARVARAIDGLENNPRPPRMSPGENPGKIVAYPCRRLENRYEIDDQAREVTIITVGHRSEFYE